MQYATHRNSQTASNGNNTKKAAKRRKMSKQESMRKPDPIKQIYQKVTEHNLAVVADEATEKRLSKLGPPTSTRLAGYNYIY